MDIIINYAVKEIVPRELEEQILYVYVSLQRLYETQLQTLTSKVDATLTSKKRCFNRSPNTSEDPDVKTSIVLVLRRLRRELLDRGRCADPSESVELFRRVVTSETANEAVELDDGNLSKGVSGNG